MKRSFYDLYIDYSVGFNQGEKLLRQAGEKGFYGIAITIPYKVFMRNPSKYFEVINRLRLVASENKIDIVSRLHVEGEISIASIKRLLRKYRYKFELISLENTNRSITAFACRDSRVDIITMRRLVRLYRGDIDNLASTNNRIELLLAPLHVKIYKVKAKFLSYYKGLLNTITRKKLSDKILFSSGAKSLENMRDPRDMAALLCLLGVSRELALDAVSINPALLVDENRAKLRGLIPSRGVRIIDK